VRFGKELEGRRLRLYFSDGDICEGAVIDVADPDDGDGFVFRLLSTNSPTKYEGTDVSIGSSAVWEDFRTLEKYEELGS
jgi:hypothetical protein